MEQIKVHLYDWKELTDQLILNESQLKLLKFLYENDYFREDMRYEVIDEEIKYIALTSSIFLIAISKPSKICSFFKASSKS